VDACRRAARVVFGDSRVRADLAPSMGAEDFAFLAQRIPACYAWIGNGAGAGHAPLHNPRYDFNDAVLQLGVRFWVQLALEVLPLDR
jgi:hippurate hydrolase